MANSNAIKAQRLGMPIGTATGRLRKSLLFKLAGLLEMLNCFQCGGVILAEGDFTIEHKRPWQNDPDPIDTFFDLENIAFSHMHCNISAAQKTNRVYSTAAERRRAGWARHYAIPENKERHLARKRRVWAEKRSGVAQSG